MDLPEIDPQIDGILNEASQNAMINCVKDAQETIRKLFKPDTDLLVSAYLEVCRIGRAGIYSNVPTEKCAAVEEAFAFFTGVIGAHLEDAYPGFIDKYIKAATHG